MTTTESNNRSEDKDDSSSEIDDIDLQDLSDSSEEKNKSVSISVKHINLKTEETKKSK